MNQLLWEIIGWFGFLQRGSVVAQILLILGLCIGMQLVKKQKWQQKCFPELQLLLAPIGVLFIAWIIALIGGKSGLVTYAGLCILGWNLLSLLQKLLLLFISESSVSQLEARLLRPIFIVIVTLNLISQFDNPADLGVISIGSLFGQDLTISSLVVVIVVTYLLLVGTKFPAASAAWLIQNLVHYSNSTREATELIIRYMIIGIGITAVSFHIGVNSTALVAVAGGLSVGLGFGIKEVFSNFISGIWLLFEGSVRPGEVLMIDNDPCEVRRLGLRATVLWRSRDNAELLIPNQMFFTNQAVSQTATDKLCRSDVRVCAPRHHEPRFILNLLEQTALTVCRVRKDPAPKALMVSYGDSSNEYSLRYWISDPLTDLDIVSDVNEAIWTAFKQEGIELP